MFSYRKSARSNSNAAEVFAETFPQTPSNLFDVQAIAATTKNAIHNILRLTDEVVTDSMFCSFLLRLPLSEASFLEQKFKAVPKFNRQLGRVSNFNQSIN